MSKYCVIDIETNITEEHGRKANFYYSNIISIGYKRQGEEAKTIYMSDDWNKELYEILQDVSVLIAHNAKFEGLYFWKYGSFQEWLKKGGKMWDTQLAEYMLTGQQHKYPALRDIAVNKYNCKEREKVMEAYWEKGIDTKDIPKDLVLYDVKNDVLDTEKVMLQQVKKAKEEGMYKLIIKLMDGLLATTEMEYNGIYINMKIFKENKQKLEVELENFKSKALNIAQRYWA